MEFPLSIEADKRKFEQGHTEVLETREFEENHTLYSVARPHKVNNISKCVHVALVCETGSAGMQSAPRKPTKPVQSKKRLREKSAKLLQEARGSGDSGHTL